jgi:TonB-dependent receptor
VLDQDFFVGDVRGSTETSWGGLLNLSVRPLPSQEVGVNVFYSRSAETFARFQEGIFPDIADGTIQNRALGFTERDLLTVQLRGEHTFNRLGRSTLEWAALRGRTTQEEPDLRFFANFIQPGGTFAATGSGIEAPSRFFRDLTEDAQDYKADLAVPFRFRSEAARFKAGGAFSRNDREFAERSFEVGTNTGSDDSFRYDGDPDRYFSDTYMGVVDTTFRRNGDINRFVFANFIEETTAPENTYDGTMDIAAAYGMVELPITSNLRMIAGARVEWTDLELISQAALADDVIDVTTGDSALVSFQDYTDVLPSLNLVYALTDNVNLRFAATRTLARPTFREVAPFTSFDFLYGDLYVGNPDLERTLINNLDLRWEWFSRPGEIIAVSGFYKLFQEPIEQTLIGGTTRQRKYNNVDEATVMGVEFEVRKALDQVSSRLANFSVGGNASLVYSRINLGENELRIRRAIDPEASDTRELQGQSPYIINLDLAYDNLDSGTTVGLYYNVFGPRLARVTLGAAPDVYERPRPVLDLTLAQRLVGGAQAKLSAKNLLNSDYQETYRFQDQDFDFYTYEIGRTFSLSVSYRL